ncbi:MAG TPA: NAD-dependent epimerase/dehydratase family protein [Candidatus Udaeobacter sp.]|nr:NAD-dependent epimerase/dehydratase family protein [Candidatus Udaeobacter sp.]
MAKILVTGVAGFIGSNLAVRLLAEGHEVIGIDDLSYGVKEQIPEGVLFHKIDIRSKEIHPLFKDVEYVFHLAAKNCISDCQKDPLETSDINVTGTVNVFAASAKAGVKKVIYAESSAVYEGTDKFPTPETVVDPHSFYAMSKVAGHYFAKAYKEFYNLDSIGVRYFNVYGPRQDYRRTIPPLMSAFIINLLRGEQPVIYGTGEKRRDFVYIDDINDAHVLLMKEDSANNQVYNIGSGENYSVNEIYKIIKDLTGSSIDPIYKDNLAGEAEITLADCRKLQNLGWQLKTSLPEGIKQQIDYIKKHVL